MVFHHPSKTTGCAKPFPDSGFPMLYSPSSLVYWADIDISKQSKGAMAVIAHMSSGFWWPVCKVPFRLKSMQARKNRCHRHKNKIIYTKIFKLLYSIKFV